MIKLFNLRGYPFFKSYGFKRRSAPSCGDIIIRFDLLSKTVQYLLEFDPYDIIWDISYQLYDIDYISYSIILGPGYYQNAQ